MRYALPLLWGLVRSFVGVLIGLVIENEILKAMYEPGRLPTWQWGVSFITVIGIAYGVARLLDFQRTSSWKKDAIGMILIAVLLGGAAYWMQRGTITEPSRYDVISPDGIHNF